MSADAFSLPLRLALPRPSKDVVPVSVDGPLAVATLPWQFEPPAESLVVVAKLTLALDAGVVAVPCPEPEPLSGDEPWEEGASLRRASDFAAFKPRADVTLVGHAYSRPDRPTFAHVHLRFGELHRELAVVGDRRWSRGVPTAPEPFERMPLTWERAFGGQGFSANPRGRGVDGKRLPNLERPGALVTSPEARPEPVAFAPVPRESAARMTKLGRFDEAWLRERWPYFPSDVDWSHENAAPSELQVAYPRGDERFELAGVHPERPVVAGELPGLCARAFAIETIPEGTMFREVKLVLDTVSFDADALRVSLVWRGRLAVRARGAPELVRIHAVAESLTNPAPLPEIFSRLTRELVEKHGPTVLVSPGAPLPTPAPAPRPVRPPPRVASDEARSRLAAVAAEGRDLVGADLAGFDLRGLDLSKRALAGANLADAALDGARLDGCDLRGAVLTRARLDGASLRGADLGGANLSGAFAEAADLGGANLEQASLPDLEAPNARFDAARLKGSNLTDAMLDGASFDGAEAERLVLSGARLAGATFVGAALEDAQLHDVAAPGAHLERACLLRARFDGADLAGAVLEDADATEGSFENVNLERARLARATLDDAVLAHARLDDAVLDRASAKGARLRGASLVRAAARQANLMGASLEGGRLHGADLRGANLHGVNTFQAELGDADLALALLTDTALAPR